MASQKELLSVKGQEKMEKLKDASWDDMGGPELDWSTDQYMNFKFDATRGVKSDSTILAKASVKAEKAETVKEAVDMDDMKMLDVEVEEEKDEDGEDKKTEKKNEDGESVEVEKEKQPEEDSVDEASEDFDTDAPDAPETKEDMELPLSDDMLEMDLNDLMDGVDDMNMINLDPMKAEEAEDGDEDEDYAPSGKEPEDTEDEGEDEDKKDDVDEASEMWDEENDNDDDESSKKKLLHTEKKHEDDEDESKPEPVDEDEDDLDKLEESRLVLSFKFDQADKLFENNNVLTEEDKRQGRVLFEAAIRDVAKQVAVKLSEAYSKKFQHAKALQEKKLVKQVDQYLNYIVEQWAKENKVGLKSQIQVKLTENFMKSLKNVFQQHYIDVPNSKVNVVEALAKNVKTLKQQVRVSEEKAVQLHSELKTAVARERQALVREHKARLIAEAATVLPAAERGQFVKRAELLTFSNTKNYKKDLVALREQYFVAKPSVERPMNVPDAAPLFEEKPAPVAKASEIDVYAKALERFSR